jgi:hypothetical protein
MSITRGGRLSALLSAGVLAVLTAGIYGATTAYGRVAKPTTISFGAFTAQQWPVLFQVSTNRLLITRMAIVMDEKCQSGITDYGVGSGDVRIPIARNGTFSDTFSDGPLLNPDGSTTSYSDQVSGRFNKARTRITGTWHESSTFTKPAGGGSDTCDSGTVAFTAID